MSKAWLKNSLVRSGALRLASRFSDPGVAIIMYHSVMDDPSKAQTVLGSIIHSTEVFRGQMEWMARHFRAVSMDDVSAFLRGEKPLPQRAVVVTFDDGYTDNHEAATRVLDPLGVPGAFYVTVDCVDKQQLPWPSLLRHSFLSTKKENWTDANQQKWSLASTEERTRAFEHVSEHCSRLSGAAQDHFVTSIQSDLETGPPQISTRPMMTWDEIRELAKHGHTVGSHTMTHPNLAQIPDNDMQTELVESRRRIEQELGRPIAHFSYPCPALQPHWEERTVKASREAGYQTAVTTNGGMVRRHDDPLSLRRIRPTKTIDGLRWNLECAFLGRIV